METTTCASCGGAMRPAERWCSLCLAPRAVRPDVPLVADVRSAPAPARASGPYALRPVPRYSRWRGGSTSFGPRGRILASLLAFVPLVWVFYSAGLFGLAFGIIWIVFGIPLVLRDVWKRQRIGYGPPDRLE